VISSGVLTQLLPLLSFGLLSGFCSGLAIKKIGKSAAVLFGTLFLAIQAAAKMGYVQECIQWKN
jgi:uncharacterized membrane protein (Fun14 family)